MKKLILALALCFTVNSFADCRPAIEVDLVKKITSQKKLATAGMIASGATFITVGGFWGYMGVALVGSLWSGALIGSTFGAIATLPVGTTFIIISAAKKKHIKNLGRTLSIINGGEEFDLLFQRLVEKHPNLTEEGVADAINELNNSGDLCNGVVARYKRIFKSKKRLSAIPRDIERYLDAKIPKLY